MSSMTAPGHCTSCGADVEPGPEGFTKHIPSCTEHILDDAELKKYGIDPEACVKRNSDKFLGRYDIIDRYPRMTRIRHDAENESTSAQITSEYIHHSAGVMRIDYTPEGKNITNHTVRPLLNCHFKILSKLRFAEMDEDRFAWNITVEGEDYTGTHDQIIDEIGGRGFLVGSKEEARQSISYILSMKKIPEQKVFPCVGLFMEKGKLVYACNEKMVFPTIYSQKIVARFFFDKKNKAATVIGSPEHATRLRNAWGASVDFINSMPKINRLPALIARGYSVISPLSYEFRKSLFGIFPYLYLYGPTNSAKTHIAKVCIPSIYGESSWLDSDSVKTSFRLGQAFAASKFPRMIDEAQDIFAQNQSIFKSAATGVMATERGKQDMTVTPYPAFCTFVLTSNFEPIAVDQDAQGGVTNRLIVVPCNNGPDFNAKLYNSSHRTLSEDGFLIGEHICEYLKTYVNEEAGWSKMEAEIISLSAKIMTLYPKIQQRRSFSLAELLMGVDMYLDLLKTVGTPLPEFCKDREKLHYEILELVQSKATEDEKIFLRSLIEWLHSNSENKYSQANGVYPLDDGEFLITTNTLRQYAKAFNNHSVLTSMDSLVLEFRKIGLAVTAGACAFHGVTMHGVKVDTKSIQELLNGLEPENNGGGAFDKFGNNT